MKNNHKETRNYKRGRTSKKSCRYCLFKSDSAWRFEAVLDRSDSSFAFRNRSCWRQTKYCSEPQTKRRRAELLKSGCSRNIGSLNHDMNVFTWRLSRAPRGLQRAALWRAVMERYWSDLLTSQRRIPGRWIYNRLGPAENNSLSAGQKLVSLQLLYLNLNTEIQPCF